MSNGTQIANKSQISSETKRFLNWYQKEQKKGLQSIIFCLAEVDNATVESFFAEVNTAIHSKTLTILEL